jgi:hypothetical protein
MTELFIDEKRLDDIGLSERDFQNGSTLTAEQITKLRDILSTSSLNETNPITVYIKSNNHGITLVQN